MSKIDNTVAILTTYNELARSRVTKERILRYTEQCMTIRNNLVCLIFRQPLFTA